MINDSLIKAIVLVTVMQSLLLVGIEVASYYREQRYIKRIEDMEMFSFYDKEFEEEDLLDFTNVPHSCVPHSNVDHTQIDKLNSKNVVTIAKNEVNYDVTAA